MEINDLIVHENEADTWWSPDSKMAILNSFNPPKFDYFRKYINIWKGLKVLDVGCGGGFTSEYLSKKGAKVYGIDISSKLIRAAIDHAQLNSYNIDYKQAAAENMPFDENTFDVVLCMDVLEHVNNLKKVIIEVARVLKGNGYFFFDTVNKTEESKFVMITLLENTLNIAPKGSHDWNKFVEPEELYAFLTENRFDDIELKGFEVGDKDEATGLLQVNITDNTSVMYIGKAKLSARA